MVFRFDVEKYVHLESDEAGQYVLYVRKPDPLPGLDKPVENVVKGVKYSLDIEPLEDTSKMHTVMGMQGVWSGVDDAGDYYAGIWVLPVSSAEEVQVIVEQAKSVLGAVLPVYFSLDGGKYYAALACSRKPMTPRSMAELVLHSFWKQWGVGYQVSLRADDRLVWSRGFFVSERHFIGTALHDQLLQYPGIGRATAARMTRHFYSLESKARPLTSKMHL